MGREDAGAAAATMLAVMAVVAGVGIVGAFADAATGDGKWPVWSAHGNSEPAEGPRFTVSAYAYQHTEGTFSWEATWRDLDAKPNDHSRDVTMKGVAPTALEAVAAAQAAYHELSGGAF